MIVDHVHDHTDTCLVQGHHHLLEFPDTDFGLVRIGRIGAVGHVIVFRVISPVVLRLVEAGLVHRRIVVRRKQMHVSHSQFLQVIHPRTFSQISMCTLFRQRHEFAPMLDSRNRIDGKVAMVHLINHDIGKTLQFGTDILLPSFRIGSLQVDDCRTVAVHAYRLGHHTRSISQPHIIHLHIKCIEESFQVSVDSCVPHAVLPILHRHHLPGRASLRLFVKHDTHLLCGRCPKCKTSGRRIVLHFFPLTLIDRIFIE